MFFRSAEGSTFMGFNFPNPVIPAKAGTQRPPALHWTHERWRTLSGNCRCRIPAFAGMTTFLLEIFSSRLRVPIVLGPVRCEIRSHEARLAKLRYNPDKRRR